ncbi:transcriptional regulator, AbrB family [uncultured Candidatus Thioglobus sp.]|nr:transcriptional regulator, AbrB family [uncultured Candidatus Thioglobus sp.]SMN00500.1 transcriptional regulator, AbrB family [uncultured Candidatus Thioglobus sp.]
MSLATLTSKGQVTIPKDIREFLHLNVGDKIEVLPTENGEAIIKPITTTVDEMFGKLKRQGQKTIAIEDMDAALEQGFREQWR